MSEPLMPLPAMAQAPTSVPPAGVAGQPPQGAQAANLRTRVTVWALSADPLARAKGEADEQGWTLPILTGLAQGEMRSLGLFISSPR